MRWMELVEVNLRGALQELTAVVCEGVGRQWQMGDVMSQEIMSMNEGVRRVTRCSDDTPIGGPEPLADQ